jgi:hypothetical protein
MYVIKERLNPNLFLLFVFRDNSDLCLYRPQIPLSNNYVTDLPLRHRLVVGLQLHPILDIAQSVNISFSYLPICTNVFTYVFMYYRS